jgi:hypothetical protein
MTKGFETLIYTDCRPGQGLQGTAGLQFQAKSVNAPPESLNVAKRSLLYEPPSNWMRERRQPADYPPSFAHVGDELFATAAGVYLGREANGTREGNQLTHCIVATEPEAYAPPLRPAQLFQAPFWVREPAPTTTCQSIPGGWEPGPLGVEEIQEFVRAQPDGAAMLQALVSALHTVLDGGPRVLFVAEDASAVMAWIAAGTLLVPHEQSLRIGFKVFSTDPARASQPIVAVHPAWDSTTATVENDLGYAVFDLTRHEWSKRLEVTDVARAWAQAFCTTDDAYDVVDAVEVAGESGLASMDAVVLGRVAVLEDELTEANARVVANWLRATPPALLANYRGPMVDRLLRDVDRWPASILLDLDEVVRLGQVPADRSAAVRVALIRVELGHAARAATVPDAVAVRLPDGHWLDLHQAEAEQALLAQLQMAASPAVFDALLRVGHRFGLRVRVGQVGRALADFVRDWAANPGRPYNPKAWAAGDDIEDSLVDLLNDQVPPDRAAAVEFARRWRPQLGHRLMAGEFTGPMHQALLSVAMAHGTSAERQRLVDSVLSTVQSGALDDRTRADLVAALWGVVEPSLDELRKVAERVPMGTPLPSGVARTLERRVANLGLELADLTLARTLYDRRLFNPTPVLGRLLEDDRRLGELCTQLGQPMSDHGFDQLADSLRRCAPGVIAVRSADIVRAMLHLGKPKRVRQMLGLRLVPPELYYGKLIGTLREERIPAHAATALYLSESQSTPDKVARRLKMVVVKWIETATEAEIEAALKVAVQVGEQTAIAWQEKVDEVLGKGWFKRLLTRRPR